MYVITSIIRVIILFISFLVHKPFYGLLLPINQIILLAYYFDTYYTPEQSDSDLFDNNKHEFFDIFFI